MLLKKSLDMFNYRKSETDLGELAGPIQFKVLCDWLRNIHQQNIQLARKLTVIQNLINVPIPEDEGPPDDIEREWNDKNL